MRVLLALCAGLACAACRALPVAIETEDALVHASPEHEDEAREALEVVRVYGPVIQRTLGVESERPVIYLLDGELEGDAIGCFGDFRGGPAIRVGTDGLPRLRAVLVHELVHWNAMTTRWKTLPQGLQQGLAYWLQLDLVELLGRIQASIDAPERELVRSVLTLSDDECDGQTASSRYSAALWLVTWLGVPRLTALVERAESEQVETVPAEWIESLLPERLERVAFPPLQELAFYDSAGALLGTEIGTATPAPLPAGATSRQVRALDLPAYDGLRMIFPGMSVSMPAPH